MRILNRALLVSAFGGLTALVAACPARLDDRCANGTCDPSASSGSSGDGGEDSDVKVPEGCELSKPVKESPKCIDGDIGVFVSASGEDAATGKKDAPVRTIAKGIELAARDGRPRVYVCDGQYPAGIELKVRVSIVGGLDCSWNPADKRPIISPAKGTAVRISKVSGISLQDLEVIGAADPNIPGDSAISIFVSEATDVKFRGLVVRAGDATNAVTAGTKSNWTGLATVGATAAMGGGGPSCSCLDGTSSSKGGNGGAIGLGGTTGSATPSVGMPNGGGGGDSCLQGGDGEHGGAGTGGEGALKSGTLSNVAWTNLVDAKPGLAGGPGQGGGGGGGRNGVTGGGGGGCGGCGGGGGEPGLNGGSSFAVVSFASTLEIRDSDIATGKGGNGGAGGPGQDGQAGAGGGVGACDGGPGGNGAGGSGGGGGAGGHSVPVAFTAPQPTIIGGKATPGGPGAPGQGGPAGGGPTTAGKIGKPGAGSKSQATLAL